jgi:flagellar protein FlbT
MTGLVIKLAPGERILINGAVIENGDRRTRINIQTPNANVLRLKDAIHPNDAITPVKRLVYSIQLVLLGEKSASDIRGDILKGIEDLSQVFTDPDSRLILDKASISLSESNFYKCLKSLRSLIPREDRLMAFREL